MTKGKILFSGNTAWSMYNFRRKVFSSFVEQDYIVIVVAPYDEEFTPKIENLGCKFIALEIEAKGKNPIQDFGIYRSYKRIFQTYKPDFCFFYTIKPNIYGSLAAGRLKIPHIAITTGLGYIFLKRNIVAMIAKKLYKIAFRKAQQVWFLNEEDKQAFLDEKLVEQDKMYVLHGEGIDLSRFYKSDFPKKISFLLSARMLWDKGVGEYVGAARILKKKYPEVDFNLLGFLGVENPSAIPTSKIEEWEKEGIVKYLGKTDDVRPFIANSTCVVLPSYREGIPFSLLEGAAMYRPLVATDAIGCRDTIDDGKTGYFCEVKNVDSLGSALEKIINMDSASLEKMGEAGRDKIEKEFNVNDVIKKYQEEIDTIIK